MANSFCRTAVSRTPVMIPVAICPSTHDRHSCAGLLSSWATCKKRRNYLLHFIGILGTPPDPVRLFVGPGCIPWSTQGSGRASCCWWEGTQCQFHHFYMDELRMRRNNAAWSSIGRSASPPRLVESAQLLFQAPNRTRPTSDGGLLRTTGSKRRMGCAVVGSVEAAIAKGIICCWPWPGWRAFTSCWNCATSAVSYRSMVLNQASESVTAAASSSSSLAISVLRMRPERERGRLDSMTKWLLAVVVNLWRWQKCPPHR